jgi:hypothetical protein
MTTADHLRELINEHYVITGMMARAVVELITADNDEQAEMHAKAVVKLSEGCNTSLDNLRRWCADAKVLGRDNWYEFLEKSELEELEP